LTEAVASGYRLIALLLARLLLVAIVIGTSMALSATGTVSLGLVLSMTLTWSFVVLIQLAAAVAVIGPASGRTGSLGCALDEFFQLHVPWSAWLMALALFTWLTSPLNRPSNTALQLTAAFPAMWTALLIYRFCREALGDSHRAAIVRTLWHQAIIWTSVLVIGGAAVGLWPRILWVVAR
jgi:hypothetical protein